MENSVFITLNNNELLECDGGSWIPTAVKVFEFLGALDALNEFVNGFKQGWSDGWK